MDNLIIPQDYRSALNLHDTQIGIKTVKDFFSRCSLPKGCICCGYPPLYSWSRHRGLTIT